MEGIALEYLPPQNNSRIFLPRIDSHSYISDEHEQYSCDSHTHMVKLFKKSIELGFLVYGKSTVWEETGGCTKQYQHDIKIYLMNVLSHFFKSEWTMK